MNEQFKKTGFLPADILLPQDCDMEKWSVVACDQYTSEPEYWNEVKNFVDSAPSTFHQILPEASLKADDVGIRIENINKTMQNYIDKGLFNRIEDSFVFVERTLANGDVRHGLVGEVDLENYDYNKGASSLIRATEGTVLDRIPPRVRVREGAALELPHVMLLIDDVQETVIEPLVNQKAELDKLYDFELMQGGGHIKGWRVVGDKLDGIANALTALASPQVFNEKYGVTDDPVLLFAVGDGNHSLATAKECWEHIKKTLPNGKLEHPARYALVELVNIHDNSLNFEPIHRVVFGVNPQKLLSAFERFYNRKGETTHSSEVHTIEYIYEGGRGAVTVSNPESGLAVGTLQNFLDSYIKENGGSVDYIHGTEIVESLGSQPENIGFTLPAMGKSELFKTVITDGVLPRKTFSMGHACDKRFYLESRKIK
jgi:uncharacterized protein (DUF1015 family)